MRNYLRKESRDEASASVRALRARERLVQSVARLQKFAKTISVPLTLETAWPYAEFFDDEGGHETLDLLPYLRGLANSKFRIEFVSYQPPLAPTGDVDRRTKKLRLNYTRNLSAIEPIWADGALKDLRQIFRERVSVLMAGSCSLGESPLDQAYLDASLRRSVQAAKTLNFSDITIPIESEFPFKSPPTNSEAIDHLETHLDRCRNTEALLTKLNEPTSVLLNWMESMADTTPTQRLPASQ
jgi:hypothetical protein